MRIKDNSPIRELPIGLQSLAREFKDAYKVSDKEAVKLVFYFKEEIDKMSIEECL